MSIDDHDICCCSHLSQQALQAATNSLYKVFFRFAPFLAGSQETGGSGDVRNEQIVDLGAEAVDNIVDVREQEAIAFL